VNEFYVFSRNFYILLMKFYECLFVQSHEALCRHKIKLHKQLQTVQLVPSNQRGGEVIGGVTINVITGDFRASDEYSTCPLLYYITRIIAVYTDTAVVTTGGRCSHWSP